MTTDSRNLRINDIMEKLKGLPPGYLRRVYVVGSVASGKEEPGDLDILFDVSDRGFNQNDLGKLSFLLGLGSRRSGNYGLFDPFVLFRDRLVSRNDECNGWQIAQNSRALKKDFAKNRVHISDVSDLRADCSGLNP